MSKRPHEQIEQQEPMQLGFDTLPIELCRLITREYMDPETLLRLAMTSKRWTDFVLCCCDMAKYFYEETGFPINRGHIHLWFPLWQHVFVSGSIMQHEEDEYPAVFNHMYDTSFRAIFSKDTWADSEDALEFNYLAMELHRIDLYNTHLDRIFPRSILFDSVTAKAYYTMIGPDYEVHYDTREDEDSGEEFMIMSFQGSYFFNIYRHIPRKMHRITYYLKPNYNSLIMQFRSPLLSTLFIDDEQLTPDGLLQINRLLEREFAKHKIIKVFIPEILDRIYALYNKVKPYEPLEIAHYFRDMPYKSDFSVI